MLRNSKCTTIIIKKTVFRVFILPHNSISSRINHFYLQNNGYRCQRYTKFIPFVEYNNNIFLYLLFSLFYYFFFVFITFCFFPPRSLLNIYFLFYRKENYIFPKPGEKKLLTELHMTIQLYEEKKRNAKIEMKNT